MGLMKSLFGNRGAQQVAENKLVITEVGPNPAQVIAIAQNYFPEDPTGIATVLNDNILEGQSTIITLPETESLYEMQQALDNAGASTYIQKNWQDEEDAPALANIVIYSIGEQKDAVIECYHNILGFEGKIGDTRMVVSKQGVNLLDTIIDGNTITSSVDGVDINAGYFITKSNSQGIKTVIYYATFDMGENTIYVEYSGTENESETVKNNLVDTILQLIENGAFDLSQIQE